MPDPNPIPWHRRMEARVVLAVSVFVGLSLAAVLAVTTRAVTSRSLARASEDLEAARTAFARLVANRAEFAAAQTRLITSLPVFRAHMTDVRLASDLATLEAMADSYRHQLNAQFCIVTDSTGRWIGSPGWPTGAKPPESVREGIGAAVSGRSERTIAPVRQQLFLVISEPARFAEETLGTLTIGYPLDDAVARELAELTHSEVSLATGGDLSGSSLPQAARAELRELINETRPQDEPNGSLVIRRVGDIPYVTGTFSLLPSRASSNGGRLVLLQDWRPTQQFLDELRNRLLLAGFGTFALAMVGGIAFSRRMSRPLNDVVEAAGEIASGSWARQVPLHGSAEATTMAKAFNEMTSHLRHRHEQAEDRAERLQTSMEASGLLAGGVAHDINNLLMAIQGYGELVLHGLDPDDKHRDDIDEILKASGRAAALTRQLLAFSRRQVLAPQVLALEEEAPMLPKRGSETVLLVEDDDRVRALVATMLQRCGYAVLDADGGEQALGIVRAHGAPIDLLLTDVVMPGMNGRVLAERLQALSPTTRVLFMSGYSDDTILRAGIQAAETAFLQKPFSSAALAAKIRDVLKNGVSRSVDPTPTVRPLLSSPSQKPLA